MDSFFIYRLPNSKDFIGSCGNVSAGLHKGFLVCPFSCNRESLRTIIPKVSITLNDLGAIHEILSHSERLKIKNGLHDPEFSFPIHSTAKEKHLDNVKNMISQLNDGEKTICTRVILGDGQVDIEKSFLNLADEFPGAMIFCFHTPDTGTWIGATPETLLRINDRKLFTMALAGTRKADSKEPWDKKNIVEHEIVVNYIRDALETNGLKINNDLQHTTSNAGTIEHLSTTFDISLPKEFSEERLKKLLLSLSPTPALCGFPKEKALRMISELEENPRGYYGGFMGPVNSKDKLWLFVILRSLWIKESSWCMMVGGGITPDSNPSNEWIETEIKAHSILKSIVLTGKSDDNHKKDINIL